MVLRALSGKGRPTSNRPVSITITGKTADFFGKDTSTAFGFPAAATLSLTPVFSIIMEIPNAARGK
jgi:hypothetical protein